MTTTEQRYIDLETKISYLEMNLEALLETVRENHASIEALKESLKRLESDKVGGADAGNEKPPHY